MTAPSNAPGAGWPAEPAASQDWDPPEVVEASARAWEQADHDSDPYSTEPASPPAPYLRRVWAQSEVETIEVSLDFHDALAATGPDTLASTAEGQGQDGGVVASEATAAAGSENDGDDVVEVKYATVYADVYEWYEHFFRLAYRRRIDGRRRYWSATWYTHPEVLERMDALWRSWEKKRRDPEVGASEWWLHHADPHMSFLMSPEGPFADLDHDVHGKSSSMEPLPWTAPDAQTETDPVAQGETTTPRATMSILARYRARRARRGPQD